MVVNFIFSSWQAKEGPRKDRYNISDNPQYRLELKSNQHAAVWCLLTRHITDKVCIILQRLQALLFKVLENMT